MKNFIKKFSTMVLSVAMLMTSGVILPSVSAANFKPIIEGSKWTSSDTVTVTFSDNVTLADDAKEKVVLTTYGQETPLNASDEVTASGKNVKIKLAGGYKYYSGLKFKAGALKSADGTPTTSDAVGYSISLDKGITSLSVADKNVPAAGKTVNVQVTGKNLDFGDPINLKVYAGSTKTNIEAKLVATSNTTGTIKLVIPENTSADSITYKIKKQKGYTFSYEDVDASFSLVQAGKTGSSTPGTGVTPVAPTEVKVNSVSYDKTSLDSNGGAVVAELSGVGFTQVDALKAKVYKVNPEGTVDDALLPTQVEVVDDTHAKVKFTLPANSSTSTLSYALRVATKGNVNYSAIKDMSNQEQLLTVPAKAQEQTGDNSVIPAGAKTFALDIDDWSAYNMGDGQFNVIFKKPVSLNSQIDIKKFIYFSDRGSKKVDLTDNDTVTLEGNVLTIQLADKDKKVPSYLMVKAGALKNDKGAYLKYKMDGTGEHFRYITDGAHVDSMEFNKITFDSNGGHLVATIKGHNLKNNVAGLPEFNVNVAKNDVTLSDVTPYNLTVDVKSNTEAVVTADLPANATDRTESYRIIPVIYGRQIYSTYIKGYDIVSVLPAGKNSADKTLSTVMVSGASDENPAPEIYEVDVKSHNVSLKINAVLRGTNLDAKKMKVKVVDENGTEWPAKPVYECGATYRWQWSNMYLPNVPSKNEQHIELLVPRALGMDHTFTLTFAPDGENFDENLKATVIVRNDGIIDTSNAAFNMDDYTKLRTITVNYVDKNGNKVAEPKHVKAYGIHELYALGLTAKDIDGYKLVKADPDKALLDAMLATPDSLEDGRLNGATVFVKAFPYNTITYTYEKTATPAPIATGYNFTVGKDAVWSAGDLGFKIENTEVDKNAAGDKVFDRFQGIEVDGQTVDPSNYEAKAGSVVLTLRESYIRSLGTGRHSIKAKFRGGESASTSFSVTRAGAGSSVSSRPGAGAGAASRPGMARVGAVHRNVVKTGDGSNAFTYALVLVLAAVALAGVVSYRRKRA